MEKDVKLKEISIKYFILYHVGIQREIARKETLLKQQN